MYGCYFSTGTVSNISKRVANQIESYHQRRLSYKFFCVGIHIGVRQSVWLLGLRLMSIRRPLTIVSP
ncbi:hypothetical protein ACXO2X_09215 [Lactobacillus delbrueckii subsp. bulgaricus]